MVLAVSLLAAAIAVGIYEGLRAARPLTVVVTAAIFLGISNLLASWPWFVADRPQTWHRTYFSALAFTGLASLLVHVAPLWLAWYFAKRLKSGRRDHTA